MIRRKQKSPLWVRFSYWLAIALFRPLIYVMVGATVGLGLLAAVFGADPSAVMAGFVAEATTDIWPIVLHLLGIWAGFTAFAAILSADIGEICRLSDTGRSKLGYILLGQYPLWFVPTLSSGLWLGRIFDGCPHVLRNRWRAGVHPPLVYE